MASNMLQLSLPQGGSSSSSLPLLPSSIYVSPFTHQRRHFSLFNVQKFRFRLSRSTSLGPLFVNKEEDSATYTVTEEEDDDDDDDADPDPQSLEYVSQIKRVLELLKRNRDMLFGEVKLTIMIEDPRDVERRRLLGIDDENAPTRDDLAAALEEINEGKVPKDFAALQMLAEEMNSWPNLEVEATKQNKPGRSLYAKATDTGIDPKEAAKRLKIDWDSAAEIDESAESDEPDVPPALGYGALYLVSAFPIIIGISVVLILFYNSLQ
ncbi:PREDICTED: ycf3-interacting protein 1, chloroplastic [Nicotiana attenuata]|uniref:Ycf3-interacting protein 1, chloroplastic n=1 Tax=Nicotiana attenuata TaxID=49451 RepID=A0A314KUQ8_NICAT|nr:PREDICTED: ycf3-interacting protein 1, chloroplastic [Nicotiana attenuata]OIT33126.1 ycf3-interacting protein 1, chloroplastic [Nicotiana attenuata]